MWNPSNPCMHGQRTLNDNDDDDDDDTVKDGDVQPDIFVCCTVLVI